MNPLFYSLLYTPKIRRWIQLLDRLEAQEHTTAVSLANLTQCSKRTIHADIKELKDHFQDTMTLSGDDHGSHFSLQDPKGYYQKKQALIRHEPIFFLFDRMLEEKKATNHQLAQELSVPLATFNRMKRYCAQILQQFYRLGIDPTTNVLLGPETAIRQFMYDFYCTCSLYPEALEKRVTQFRTTPLVLQENRWKFEPILASQWTQIFKDRVSRGHLLSEEETKHSLQSQLSGEWQRATNDSLTEREQATLFVLSLDESAFFHPEYQQAFLQNFSMLTINEPVNEDNERLPVLLFETLILFLQQFFQLPREVLDESEKHNQEPATYLLHQLIGRYQEENQRLRKTITLTYDLIGSAALKNWIKHEVQTYASKRGFELIESSQTHLQPLIRHLTITNKPVSGTVQQTIVLPLVPSGPFIEAQLNIVLEQSNL